MSSAARKDRSDSMRTLRRRIRELERANEALLACLEEASAADETHRLRRELIEVRRAYLEDVEKDIQVIGEYLHLASRFEQVTGGDPDGTEDMDMRWKEAYQALARSKLGRLQRFWWRLTARR